MNKKQSQWKVLGLSLVGIVLFGATVISCQQSEPPARLQVTVPSVNQVSVGIQLTARYGLNLGGEFPIQDFGSIFFTPESPSSGLGFGFRLNSSVFRHDNWINYQEVTTLPTNAAFPAWMTGPVVDIVVPPANINALAWHFYIGTRQNFYVGAAALISAINQNFPSLRIEYSFYDPQGKVIVGLVFFGPKIENGRVVVPGGIFVGTNVSPYLPAEVRNWIVNPPAPTPVVSNPEGAGQILNSAMLDSSGAMSAPGLSSVMQRSVAPAPSMAQTIAALTQQSASSDIRIVGADAPKYRDARKVRELISRFTSATR